VNVLYAECLLKFLCGRARRDQACKTTRVSLRRR
jgi:hypothetical protein